LAKGGQDMGHRDNGKSISSSFQCDGGEGVASSMHCDGDKDVGSFI